MFFLNENEDYTNLLNEEVEGHYDGVEGGLELVLEAECMYSNLQQRMTSLEFEAIVSENALLVEEGKKSFFESFKGIVDRMIKGIMAMFKNFVDWITKLVSSDEKLAVRFESSNVVVTLNGYDYSGLDKYAANLESGVDMTQFATYENDKIIKTIGAHLGLTGDITKSTFKKLSMRAIRGSEDPKTVKIKLSEAAKYLKAYKTDINQAKKAKDEIIKDLQTVRKNIKDKKGTDRTDENKLSGAVMSTSAKELISTLTLAYGCLISGLKERRGMARQAVRSERKGDDGVRTESTNFITGILADF